MDKEAAGLAVLQSDFGERLEAEVTDEAFPLVVVIVRVSEQRDGEALAEGLEVPKEAAERCSVPTLHTQMDEYHLLVARALFLDA